MKRPAKTKGSAEAATSPSHGSNNPSQENAVNRQQHTTARSETASASSDTWDAFDALEGPIIVAKGLADVLGQLSEALRSFPYRGGADVIISKADLGSLQFMIGRTMEAIDHVDTLWLKGSNDLASRVSQPAVSKPSGKPDPLLALVNEYRAGLAVFNASSLELTPEQDQALQATTWEPSYDRLRDAPPAATTLEGVIAAVRLVADEEETCGSQPQFTIKTLRAAMAFFDKGGA